MGRLKVKGKAGAAKNYITRSSAVKKLQCSLADFRRLCILKGIDRYITHILAIHLRYTRQAYFLESPVAGKRPTKDHLLQHRFITPKTLHTLLMNPSSKNCESTRPSQKNLLVRLEGENGVVPRV
jgi:hypothetical protein